MELDFDKYCVVDGSPTTVLPAPHRRSKAAYRKSNGMHKCGNDITEISFNRYLSASCRDVRSKRANHELPKRGSVYQNSKEVNLLSKTDGPFRREKVELSRESASALSPFGIIDSLCGSDEDRSLAEPNRCSVMSTSEQSTSSFCKNQIEKYAAVNLHKSRLAKLALPHSPARSESDDGSKTNSPKSVFNPSARKKFDPFVKSRIHRSPLSHEISENIGLSCNEKKFKPQVKDFSDNLKNSLALSSPAHLHGVLKSENKNGVPFFEFSVKSPEDVYYVAKTWKVDNALTWVYTFHSLHHKRKSNASGWGFKDNSRESTMVGQMAMSCYLCTELKCTGAFNDSMVTEYVLYDIAQSRRSTSSHEDNSSCSPDITKAPLVSDCDQNESSAKKMNKGRIFKHSQPLAVAELHPELETAVVIMQVPFEKRESLKFKSGDSEMYNPVPNLLDLCRLEEVKEGICDNLSRGKMHVVIPYGNHSFPSSESRGPSPLLDRWRLGGGCDCGGWDMACPIDVFVNPNFRIADGQQHLMDDGHPVELFVQGRKDNDIAAFSMRAIEEDGKYAVDFHAQLSSLQAFSICVAILHAASTSAVEHERSLQTDSLRVFAEEEIKKFKANNNNNNNKEQVFPPPPSFVINPPFSPIARV